MSADLLREAAALMRSRAERALENMTEQGWKPGPTIDPDNMGWYVASDIPEADWDTTVAHLPYDYDGEVACHIASWHPAVALAVADWLEEAANDLASRQRNVDGLLAGVGASGSVQIDSVSLQPAALAVARAYLGATP